MTTLVLLGIVVLAVVWAIAAYKRRHDLVPNLVETVRGTLEAVVAARQRALDGTPAKPQA